MAANIQFISRTDGVAEPLAILDNKIREFMGAPPNPHTWYMGWFDYLGFYLALTGSYAEARHKAFDGYPDDDTTIDMKKIMDYLEANYKINTWHSVGK